MATEWGPYELFIGTGDSNLQISITSSQSGDPPTTSYSLVIGSNSYPASNWTPTSGALGKIDLNPNVQVGSNYYDQISGNTTSKGGKGNIRQKDKITEGEQAWSAGSTGEDEDAAAKRAGGKSY